MTEESTPEPQRPLLRVVRGTPDDVELAALTAVVAAAAAAAGGEPEPDPVPSGWADKAALVRAPLRHGAGAWRASAQPR